MKNRYTLLLITLLLVILTSCASVTVTETPTTEKAPITSTDIQTTVDALTTKAPITTPVATTAPVTTLPQVTVTEAPTVTTTAPQTTEAVTTTIPVVTVPHTTKPITPETTKPEPPKTDPYVNVSKEEFYRDYRPATSLADALYRTEHGFLSGTLAEQDQAPSIAPNQPKVNGLLVRNTSALYGDDGNSYTVVDVHGNPVNTVYKGGAYITLEDVAAYVYAFGDIPANYLSKKSASPSSNIWGEFLRLNHSKFSGDTSRYRYEPELPRISGCGGDYYYYEIDIGTTGTDCDPKYDARPYNNGYSITRGAARIVYSRFDINNNKIIDPNEKFVFYTYNHYNDFQEYLNYEGGWGKMFGNITGGGAISSNSNYNPTPYVKTAYADFTSRTILSLSQVNTLELFRKFKLHAA